MPRSPSHWLLGISLALCGLVSFTPTVEAQGQAPGQAPRGGAGAARPAPIASPEVSADKKVTFRLRAPKATEVALR